MQNLELSIPSRQVLYRYLRVKSTFLQKSKYKHLLNDPQVNRWFRNLPRTLLGQNLMIIEGR
jgi:hypothetical protein